MTSLKFGKSSDEETNPKPPSKDWSTWNVAEFSSTRAKHGTVWLEAWQEGSNHYVYKTSVMEAD
jgi:hypothetical protein